MGNRAIFAILFILFAVGSFFCYANFFAKNLQTASVLRSFDLTEAGIEKIQEEIPEPLLAPEEENFIDQSQSLSLQDQLDDIQEKLDIIAQQVQELIKEKEAENKAKEPEVELENKSEPELEPEPEPKPEPAPVPAPEVQTSLHINYPQILISEVQISPIAQRFIKLYNPNEEPVSLAEWYIQKKTATGDTWNSCVSSPNFENKTILAASYFIISRGLPNSDILIDDLTITENNTLILKNPNREISSQFTTSSEPAGSEESEPVDTTPPTGTIIINSGAEYTNSRNVTLTISASDDMSTVLEMKIANASSYHDWEPYAILKDWELPATNGVKTVRIKFKDSVGNETETGIPDTIILDTVAPVIVLNGDAVINLNVGDTYLEPGATVTDENIEDNALVIGQDMVDTSVPATFSITYNATDKAENSAVQTIRTVIINSLPE